MPRKLSPSDSCRIGQNIAVGHVLQSAWAEYERPYFCSVSVDYLRSNSLAAHILCLAMLLGTLCRAEVAPDLVLHGTVNGRQNHSYIEVPFDVPDHVERITIVFRYTGKEEHTTLDLGIEDPHGFRGWSGGNKDIFTISGSDATPSYLPGEIISGRWRLLIGVPNIRAKNTSSFEAGVYFVRHGTGPSGLTDVALRREAQWYRGDFHMHSGHSDGRCASQTGHDVPCPIFVTAEGAVRRGLDFIAVTDHNTISQYDSLRELQPYFDRMLLIPGREITTFHGHANLFGATDFVDFLIGRNAVPDMTTMLRMAQEAGGVISINHPNAPSGEVCMGCGWDSSAPMDWNMISAIEAVNGGAEQGPYSGISFWEKQLQDGHRITAIGGSDNHHADWPLDKIGSIGSPTTVVYASELSVPAILAGVKLGHAFIDLTASSDRLLEFIATVGQDKAMAGDTLNAAVGAQVGLSAQISRCRGSMLRISLDNQTTVPWKHASIAEDNQTLHFSWTSDGKYHWFRADVIASDGTLQMLDNPIYLNRPSERD